MEISKNFIDSIVTLSRNGKLRGMSWTYSDPDFEEREDFDQYKKKNNFYLCFLDLFWRF